MIAARRITTSGAAVETKYSIINNRAELDKLIRHALGNRALEFHVNDSNSNESRAAFDKVAAARYRDRVSARACRIYIDLENFEGGRDAAVAPLRDILTNGFLEKSAHDDKRNLGSFCENSASSRMRSKTT